MMIPLGGEKSGVQAPSLEKEQFIKMRKIGLAYVQSVTSKQVKLYALETAESISLPREDWTAAKIIPTKKALAVWQKSRNIRASDLRQLFLNNTLLHKIQYWLTQPDRANTQQFTAFLTDKEEATIFKYRRTLHAIIERVTGEDAADTRKISANVLKLILLEWYAHFGLLKPGERVGFYELLKLQLNRAMNARNAFNRGVRDLKTLPAFPSVTYMNPSGPIPSPLGWPIDVQL